MSESYKLNQIELVSAINTEIARQIPNLPFEPRLYNRVIKAANAICEEFKKPIVKATKGMGLQAWLDSDDVGASSSYMAVVLASCNPKTVLRQSVHYAFPRDMADFGRCVRLLEAVPQFAPLLPNLALKGGDEWVVLVKYWKELESLYEAGDAELFHKLLTKAYGEIDE